MIGRKLTEDVILERENFFLTLKKGTKVWKFKRREHLYGREFLGIFGKGDFLYRVYIKLPIGSYSKEITRNLEGCAILFPPTLAWDKILEASEEISEDIPSELVDLIEDFECDFRGNAELAFFTRGFSLLIKGTGEILSSGDLKVVKRGKEKAIIGARGLNLVINGENVVADLESKNYVFSREKVVGPGIVISGSKVVTKDFVGRNEEMAKEGIGKAWKELDEALKRNGFVPESN